MRIISGKIRGKSLASPQDEATRPTSDKARGAVFNIIEHAPWSCGIVDKNILDVFAGTGAFGLEALSRGAKFVSFVENHAQALRVIETNIKSCRMENYAQIMRQDATKLPQNPKPPYDLAFLDPPYHKGFLPRAINSLRSGKYIDENTIIIAEMEKTEILEIPNASILKEAVYGINRFIFLQILDKSLTETQETPQ